MIVATEYLHVSNSGCFVQVQDNGSGPELCFRTSSFANLEHTFKLTTTPEGIKALIAMLQVADAHDFKDGKTFAPAEPNFVSPSNVVKHRQREI